MKRILMLMLSAMLTIVMVGCSSSISPEEYYAVVSERDALKEQVEALTQQSGETEVSGEDSVAEETSKEEFDAESVLKQLKVTEYHFKNDYWNFAFLEIKNDSPYNLDISADANFYDKDKNLIGAKNNEQEAVESGCSTLLYFMPDEDYSDMEYELNVSEEEYFECVQSDLSYKVTEAEDKVILSVTNNGDKPAEFVEAYVLFFKGDSPVGFSSNYVIDDDSELKPGKTLNQEMDCYEEFDSYKVFLSGRR